MNNFKERVYLACQKIPKGKVSTDKIIAKFIGSPSVVRAVGNALNKNTNTKEIPCHRVVRSNGFVGGYAFGVKRKAEMLNKEGIIISKNGKVDLEKYLFYFKR